MNRVSYAGEFDGKEFVEWTTASSKAAEHGLKWLLKAQNPDGGFGVDHDQPSDIGCTAMAGLVLLSLGNSPRDGKYAPKLRKVLNYLYKQIRQMPKTNITNISNSQLQMKIGNQAHSFFATLFLSQIVGHHETQESPAYLNLQKVTRAIEKAQRNDGSWGMESWAPLLGTVMGWVSLRGSSDAGILVHASANKTANYILDKMKEQGQGGWMHTLYKETTGLRVLYSMGKAETQQAKEGLKVILNLVQKDMTAFNQAGGEEYLSFHLITEVMMLKGGKEWETWYSVVRDKLIKVQNADGSWTGHHCITSRTFCTACALLVLQAPNRYLPISTH